MLNFILVIRNLLLSTWMFFIIVTPAHAYIDPGSGGMLMTTIIGIIAAIGYTARKYFYRIKNLFSRNKDEDVDEDKNS